MLKDIVLAQKNEKERLLSFSYIERAKAKEAKKWLDSDLIKVVLGPRRSGKSVFSLMLLKDRPFMYFNFDDERLFSDKTFDCEELLKELHSAYGETKTIFFDEVQNLLKWELFANRLHREGYNLVLTGSNANLLSRELATALTGRHIPIEIFPFDFLEFLRAKNFEFLEEKAETSLGLSEYSDFLGRYLAGGGYPEVAVKDLDPAGYLGVLFDSLLFKDVVRRHRVRFSGQIGDLASYLMDNAGNLYGLRRLARVLGFRSGVTLEKYLRYLSEAYLVFCLKRYSVKAGDRIKSPRKIYIVDNGFILAKAVKHSPDNGRLMENLVFTELVKKGWEPNREVFYYKTRNGREIDIILKNGTKVAELIQVAWDIREEAARKREVEGLLEASKELGGVKMTVITWNEECVDEIEGKRIEFIPLFKWITAVGKNKAD
jgi:hypothetical protein